MRSTELLEYAGQMVELDTEKLLIEEKVTPNPVELPFATSEEAVEYALSHPVNAPLLEEAVKPGEKVCIVVSDITRKWQLPSVYLPPLIKRLNNAGIPDKNILIISATGIHRTQTEQEWETMIGRELMERISYKDHECDDRENLIFMGTTSRGTPVWVNRCVKDYDRLILTGGVAFHPLAGFSGGCKSLVPGIAGRETIDKNHSLAMNPGFGSGINPHSTGGDISPENPFHRDQREGSSMRAPDYLLNVVAGENGQLIRAFAGEWLSAWAEAVKLVSDMNGVYIRHRYPLVIASAGGSPKDMNISQTAKTLANVLHAVEPGGTIILLSRCKEGFGTEQCRKQLCDLKNMEERETSLRKNFTIGGFFGYLFADSAEKYNFIMVTEMTQDAFCYTKLHAVKTVEEALALAASFNGGSLESTPALLMPQGGSTLPKLK